MEKVSYALGMSIAKNILVSGVKKLDIAEFIKGVEHVVNDANTNITPEEAQKILNEFFTKLEEEKSLIFKEAGANFLAENGKKDGVVTLPSGLQYKVIKEGKGKVPTAADSVECHYEGRLIDGTKFDSSYDRNQTATFGVTQVIPGWVEALQLMPEGSKWELYIPYDLAYGERGAGQAIPPYATLVFDIELVKVVAAK